MQDRIVHDWTVVKFSCAFFVSRSFDILSFNKCGHARLLGLESSSRDKREERQEGVFWRGGSESCTRFVMDRWSIVRNHVFVPARKIFISSEECRGLSEGLEATKTSPEQIWSAIRILVMKKGVKNKEYPTQFLFCVGSYALFRTW